VCLEHWYAGIDVTGTDQAGSQDTGDTKAGTLIGMDKYGNKYFENLEEELPRKREISHRVKRKAVWCTRI